MNALSLAKSAADREAHYRNVRAQLEALLEGETDFVAAMATVVCELHHAFDYFHWTGFYRVIEKELLAVGPYQGGHGCLRIPFSRGVCGAAAREKRTQLVPDVHAFPDHIACASSTLSEIVIPIFDATGEVIAVLDIDSDAPAAFTEIDAHALEAISADLTKRFGSAAPRSQNRT